MGTIEWNPGLETGDELVDTQHRTIHEMLSELEQAADNPHEIMRVLEFLTEYVHMHFTTEEALMARTGFPTELAEPHIAEHRRLTEATRQRVFEFRDGRLSHTGQLCDFLHTWLATHVHDCDQALVHHVQALGDRAHLPDGWSIEHPRLMAGGSDIA